MEENHTHFLTKHCAPVWCVNGPLFSAVYWVIMPWIFNFSCLMWQLIMCSMYVLCSGTPLYDILHIVLQYIKVHSTKFWTATTCCVMPVWPHGTTLLHEWYYINANSQKKITCAHFMLWVLQQAAYTIICSIHSSISGFEFHINPWRTKPYLSHLKTQFVMRGKHSLPR
jgi:hypothetical protein